MSEDVVQTRIEAAMRRTLGMTKEETEALHEVWDAQPDWFAVCRKCGEKLKGSPKDLRAHRCAP